MTPEAARRRVAEARVGRLATLNPDATPHLVPFCFALDGETLVSAVDDKPKRSPRLHRLDNLRRDPHATVLVDEYDDADWARLWWVRLEATGSILDTGGGAARARALLAEKYPQYRRRPPTGAVVSLRIDRWSWWESAPR